MTGTNREGLTWPEWAYAAAVLEPPTRGLGVPAPRWNPDTQEPEEFPIHRTHHGMRGYAWRFRKERAAWRNGEDPTEWRER